MSLTVYLNMNMFMQGAVIWYRDNIRCIDIGELLTFFAAANRLLKINGKNVLISRVDDNGAPNVGDLEWTIMGPLTLAIIVSNNAKCDIALCGEAAPVNSTTTVQQTTAVFVLVAIALVEFDVTFHCTVQAEMYYFHEQIDKVQAVAMKFRLVVRRLTS